MAEPFDEAVRQPSAPVATPHQGTGIEDEGSVDVTAVEFGRYVDEVSRLPRRIVPVRIPNPKKWDAPGGQLQVSGRRARTRFEGDQVMRGAPSRCVWKQLDGLFRFGVAGHLGDEELLGRFVGAGGLDRDESAEAAFAALVERYGPMVLGVCRRVLGDRHEAEDAFQAVFLVLARKAASIARRQQLANWLYGVACRTALDARARAIRRQARERKAYAMSPSEVNPADEVDLDELRSILDEELARLPERYRGAVVLCELDGLSRHAAAQRLGIPEGTLSSRLARAKELLRERLKRRGLVPSAITLSAALAPEARALLIPPALAGSTIEAATCASRPVLPWPRPLRPRSLL